MYFGVLEMANESEQKSEGQGSMPYETLSILLPTYDGNKSTLEFYIKSVESVLELVDEESQVIPVACLIRNKLSGKAVEALSQQSQCKSWKEIKKVLRNRFGEFRGEVQLINELMHSTKDKLSIEAFADKVRELSCALINLDPSKRELYEKMAIEVFLEQLDPIVALSIRFKGDVELETAIAIARQEELKNRIKKQQNNIKQFVPPRPQVNNQNYRNFGTDRQNFRRPDVAPQSNIQVGPRPQSLQQPTNVPRQRIVQPQPGPSNRNGLALKVNYQEEPDRQECEFEQEVDPQENEDENFYIVPDISPET